LCDVVREVWWHKPSGDRWVVETDPTGAVVAAAGPFRECDWDPVLAPHVAVDARAGNYVRDKRGEFVREAAPPS